MAEEFWRLWKEQGHSNPDTPEGRSHCYMFELFSDATRIIVKPLKDQVVLTGARDLVTMKEREPEDISAQYGWKTAKCFEISSLEEAVERAKKLDPSTAEGFVVRDIHFNRLKIKSPQYVGVSLLSRTDYGGKNVERMLRIVKHNEGSEFLTYFPMWAPLFRQVKERYEAFVEESEAAWDALEPFESDPKEFGTRASKQQRFRSYLFVRKKGDVKSAREFYSNMKDNSLAKLIPSLKEIDDTVPLNIGYSKRRGKPKTVSSECETKSESGDNGEANGENTI